MLPHPIEAGERRFPCGQRIAFNFHVQEKLRADSDNRSPKEHQADLRSDEGPQNKLARRKANAGSNNAGADNAPQVAGRIRQITNDGRLKCWHTLLCTDDSRFQIPDSRLARVFCVPESGIRNLFRASSARRTIPGVHAN